MQTTLSLRLRKTLLAALVTGSMIAAATAADQVPVSAASGAGDAASTKKVSSNATITDASTRTGKIAVGVYLDTGAGPSVNDLLRALSKFDQVSVTKLTAEQIRSGGLAGLDILMHPGGSGSKQGLNLEEPGREKIRNFVREGGGFVGICAGAYLASAHYPWSLNLLDAKVIDTKHWNRGIGTVDIELTPTGREILHTTNQKLPIHYGQGPLLAPANRPEIEDYEEMATFKTEITKNGAPKGVMIGTTAIARGRFGQGRVICFSPHPEMTKGLEPFVQDAIDYVNRKPAGQSARSVDTRKVPLVPGAP